MRRDRFDLGPLAEVEGKEMFVARRLKLPSSEIKLGLKVFYSTLQTRHLFPELQHFG